MLVLWLMPQLLRAELSVVFQHKGAPPHIHNEVYVPPMPITLNKVKDWIRKAIAYIDQPLLQYVWYEVE
jgi:hypothetical protein